MAARPAAVRAASAAVTGIAGSRRDPATGGCLLPGKPWSRIQPFDGAAARAHAEAHACGRAARQPANQLDDQVAATCRAGRAIAAAASVKGSSACRTAVIHHCGPCQSCGRFRFRRPEGASRDLRTETCIGTKARRDRDWTSSASAGANQGRSRDLRASGSGTSARNWHTFAAKLSLAGQKQRSVAV